MAIRLFFDTETNGLPRGNKPPEDYPEIYPLEVAAILEDDRWPQRQQYLTGTINWELIGQSPVLDPGAAAVNGLTAEMLAQGMHPKAMLLLFMRMVEQADELVCHNIEFDWKIKQIWMAKFQAAKAFPGKARYCTMQSATELCKLPSARGGYKWPKLQELYQHFFSQKFEDAHGAMADCMAMQRCYVEMRKLGVESALGPMGG